MFKNVRFHILGFLVLFLISTSGITVYKHFCPLEGVSYNFGTLINTDICKKYDTKETKHDCCSSDISQDLKFEQNCCDEEVDVFQIHTDLNTFHSLLSLVADFTQSYPISSRMPVVNKNESFLTESFPIPITLQRRLAKVQSYLI